jgi:hypothetical protein
MHAATPGDPLPAAKLATALVQLVGVDDPAGHGDPAAGPGGRPETVGGRPEIVGGPATSRVTGGGTPRRPPARQIQFSEVVNRTCVPTEINRRDSVGTY